MESRKVTCKCCQKQFQVPPKAPRIRCNFCQALFQIGRTEQSSSDHDRNCQGGSPRIRSKNKSDSGSSTASPKCNCTPSPLKSLRTYQRKRALLCGVTYNGLKIKLKGTINDVKNMKSLLIEHFKFPTDSICVLTEEEIDPNLIPTKENIQKALKWLVEGCRAGDSLVFYFSGHGLRQPDFNQDELDGFDETLCPVDFKTAGMILDNELNTTIVKPLKEGVTLHAIIDSCHSGTILDLEHVYNKKHFARTRWEWEANKPPSGADKSTSGGLAICISACADDQMAADTTAFTGKEMTGAMTYIFVDTIKNKDRITYGGLLNAIQDNIEAAKKTRCLSLPILNKMFRYKFIQDPQLSSSEEFDVNTTEFNL